jgi:glycosyltransferase involved in cell wall biosynthesis
MVKIPAIRILFATAEPCPTFRVDVTTLFGEFLPRFGVASDVVAERAPGAPAEIRWEGGDALLASSGGGDARKHVVKLMHCALTLFRADRAKYQAIQVRDMPFVAVLGLLAARLKGRPFFYWMSYPMPEGQIEQARVRGFSAGLLNFLFPWIRGRVNRFVLYRLVLPSADHVFVQTDRMRDDVCSKGIRREKLTPVVMGIDPEVASPDRIAPADDARLRGKRVLVYLGALDREPGISVLLEMLSILKQQFPDVLLVLVGHARDKVQDRFFRRRADELGVADAIVWTGWLPMREGWRYVRAAEIGLSPFPRHPLLDCGSPTKVVEYLALGIPVVANDNPDQERVLRDGGGGLCVPLTGRDFAQAVSRLLTDEPLRRAMASSGQRYVRASRSYLTLAKLVADKYAELVHLPGDPNVAWAGTSSMTGNGREKK